ncbi:unnamed protein product [Cuscuta epithymum]|uniref:Uncharacterized protein n=1 Tax=Cuscuta epithymum TaxID=186058 RepID=A0AAV0FVA2_9ASTE|nr:unnamed protein product [Cuscuta epithymum]
MSVCTDTSCLCKQKSVGVNKIGLQVQGVGKPVSVYTDISCLCRKKCLYIYNFHRCAQTLVVCVETKVFVRMQFSSVYTDTESKPMSVCIKRKKREGKKKKMMNNNDSREWKEKGRRKEKEGEDDEGERKKERTR